MGGNALKTANTTRLNKNAYLQIATHVVELLSLHLRPVHINIIPAYHQKQDFGDLDILIDMESLANFDGKVALQALVKKLFFSTEYYQNSEVLSFDCRWSAEQTEPGFQVDIIAMPSESYEFSLYYFSYNDLGNLIGRTAHKQGCSFGHNGFWYTLRDGDYLFRKILISRNINQVLLFLGYEPARFHQGFDTLNDIFEYVANSTYFNRDIFLLHNRNHQSRIRDRKRKTYTEFLKWCQSHPNLTHYQYPLNKNEWLPILFEYFPTFQIDYQQALQDLERWKKIKEKFNGNIVTTLTGKSDKALGLLIQKIKKRFVKITEFEKFIIESDQKEIENLILNVNKESFLNT